MNHDEASQIADQSDQEQSDEMITESTHSTDGIAPVTVQKSSATLAKGEHVDLTITDSAITVRSGDNITVHHHHHYPKSTDPRSEQAKADWFPEKLKGGPLIGDATSAGTLSGQPPDGPGWSPLSDKVFICKLQPLEKNTKVYKGRYKRTTVWCDVAVKIIPYQEEYLEEVRLLEKLDNHTNIIRTWCSGVIRGVPDQIYIVMELCGTTLKQYIYDNKGKPFDFQQRFSFSKQIVTGIAFIHEKKILHRDIKLDNILIANSNEHIRIADFGLSKQLQEGRSAATASARGIGTDGYRAPEMLQLNPKASFRSDSFSLGIVLYMLFSNGQHPYGSDPIRWRTNILDNTGLDLSHIQHFKEPYTLKRDQLLNLIRWTLRPNSQDRPKPSQILHHPFFSDSVDQDRIGKTESDSAGMSPTTMQGQKKSGTTESDSAETTPDSRDDGPTIEDYPSPVLGPDWEKLSGLTRMNQRKGIRGHKMMFSGMHFINGKWTDVAIKLIDHSEETFEEVRKHLALKEHPSVIKMYEADIISAITSYIYIVTELCGGTLKEFIEETPFDFGLYFSFATQIVSGVAHIHGSNLIHRDIKLENILVTQSKDEIRVAGLGLTKLLKEGYSAATDSSHGVGFDGYQAPEISDKNPERSPPSDVFALGIVLVMLFSNGQHPFGSDPSRWRPNISRFKEPDLTHILQFKEPYVYKREPLLNLIKQCLDIKPECRPTLDEMVRSKFFSSIKT